MFSTVRCPNRCFGAVGSQCGSELLPNINTLAVCADGRCHYNGGSLTHDKCCATAPYGHACGGPETFVSGETKCKAQMDRAVALTAGGRSWIRDTDFERVNTSREWDASAVCATTAATATTRFAWRGPVRDRGRRSRPLVLQQPRKPFRMNPSAQAAHRRAARFHFPPETQEQLP